MIAVYDMTMEAGGSREPPDFQILFSISLLSDP